MRLIVFLSAVICAMALVSCSNDKVYQKYADFDKRHWVVSDTVKFEFVIEDTLGSYDLFCNIRNSTQYPFARIFLNFSLGDSTGRIYHTSLLNDFLFDPKSGMPFGKTGLGDLYDHQLSVLRKHKFKGHGPYQVNLEQFMRTDTLEGIISVGIEVRRSED